MPPTPPVPPGRAPRRGCLRRLLAVAGLLALAALIGLLALKTWRASVDRRLDTSWRQSLGGVSFLARYPDVQDNGTVRDLEKLGAAIGIDMAPADTPGRVHPAPEAAKRFEAIKEPLRNFLSINERSTDGTFQPPSPELSAFLKSVRPGLDAIRARLAAGPSPVWARDLSAGWGTELPNFLGPLKLQKLFLLDASQRLREGHAREAIEILETSWRLNEAMADNSPTLVCQLIALAVIRLQQPVLRSFPRAPAGWSERLRRLDLQPRILRAFRCEAFSIHRTASLDRPVPGEWPGWTEPYLHWMLWDTIRRIAPVIENLPKRDVRVFDTEALEREEKAKIPRWQIVARVAFPAYWETWPRSARAELEAELTALILEERERLAAGGPPRPFHQRPSRVKGLSWIYEDLPGATALHLDGDLVYQDEKPVPLRFTVRSDAEPWIFPPQAHF